MQQVVLVNENDEAVGVSEKLLAHQTGSLHRAVSVWIVNSQNQALLQRRALSKYHSAGRWSNTCCTHPEPGESEEQAVAKRLKFEMGFAAPLKFKFSFVYRSELDNGLIEHEFDHVYVGSWDGEPQPNSDEVMEWQWMDADDLNAEIETTPDKFSPWLVIMWRNYFRSMLPPYV